MLDLAELALELLACGALTVELFPDCTHLAGPVLQLGLEGVHEHAELLVLLEKPFHEQDLWDSIRRALERDAENRRRKAHRQRIQERLSQLTSGEHEVLDLILQGRCNKEIASQLQLSVRTVEDRRARLMRKMQAKSLAQLVQLATAR